MDDLITSINRECTESAAYHNKLVALAERSDALVLQQRSAKESHEAVTTESKQLAAKVVQLQTDLEAIRNRSEAAIMRRQELLKHIEDSLEVLYNAII